MDSISLLHCHQGKDQPFEPFEQNIYLVMIILMVCLLYCSFQKSEGNSYDILNCTMKDESNFKSVTMTDTRSLNRIRNSNAKEKDICSKANNQAETNDHRKINRISYQRWKDELDRGYDIITTGDNSNLVSDVENHGRFIRNQPNVHKPISEWERMTMNIPPTSSLLSSRPIPTILNLHQNTKPQSSSSSASSAPSSSSSTSRTARNPVPSLDLSTTISSQPSVKYIEPPSTAPASQLVAIQPMSKITVRTGGGL